MPPLSPLAFPERHDASFTQNGNYKELRALKITLVFGMIDRDSRSLLVLFHIFSLPLRPSLTIIRASELISTLRIVLVRKPPSKKKVSGGFFRYSSPDHCGIHKPILPYVRKVL